MKKQTSFILIVICMIGQVYVSAQNTGSYKQPQATQIQSNPNNNKNGSIVIFLAHPSLKESKANAALLSEARLIPSVRVVDLYINPKKDFNLEEHTQIVSEASAIVLQFPFYFASAPSQMKKWIDEVFYTFSQKEIIREKPLLVVTTTGSEESAYRSGGRNMFTMDELLRPYQLMTTYSGMEWRTPFVVYGMSTEQADENLVTACKQYKEVLLSLLNTQRTTLVRPAKKTVPKLSAPRGKELAPEKRSID